MSVLSSINFSTLPFLTFCPHPLRPPPNLLFCHYQSSQPKSSDIIFAGFDLAAAGGKNKTNGLCVILTPPTAGTYIRKYEQSMRGEKIPTFFSPSFVQRREWGFTHWVAAPV